MSESVQTDEREEPDMNGIDPVKMLTAMLDRLARGTLEWESRVRRAVANHETGNHVLRVRINHGVVKAVVHGVEDEI